MIEQALEALVKLAEEAKGPRILPAPSEPAHAYYLVSGGEAQLCHAEPPSRRHKVWDLESLVSCAVATSSLDKPASIWVSRTGVTVLCDDSDRRDRIELPLAASPQMQLLETWKTLNWLDQPLALRALRNVFRFSTRDSSIISTLRAMKFQSGSTTASEVGHGRASVGKSLTAEVLGQAAIPEDFDFAEPAFAGSALGVFVKVPCTIELDAAQGKIAFLPLAGSVEAAWIAAEAKVFDKVSELVAEAVPANQIEVYLGSP